jgi:hypothetical protein
VGLPETAQTIQVRVFFFFAVEDRGIDAAEEEGENNQSRTHNEGH